MFNVQCSMFFVPLHLLLSTRSLKDRITDSGSVGHGSIPCGCTLINHVNNRCYVSIALLTMPDDVLATHTLTDSLKTLNVM